MKPTFILSFLLCVTTLAAACTPPTPGAKKPATGNDARQAADAPETALQPSAADTLTVAMTGDIMMGTTYPSNALPAAGGSKLFADVKDILAQADIATGNLEGAICDTSFQRDTRKSADSYFFRMPPTMAPLLKEAGFDYLCMANNHTMDFKLAGVKATESTLDNLGIEYSGINGRKECAIVERGGVKYSFCAFGHNSYTLKHNNLDKVKDILDSLNSKADIIIVSFHGGGEGKAFSHLPYGKEKYIGEDRGDLRKFARFCIDNGADIVYGHGPHVTRCIEMYKDRLIAYSLGNFCTPYGISLSGVSSYAPVIEAGIDRKGRFLGGKIHSFTQRRGIGPRRDSTNIVARHIRSLTAADIKNGKLNIADDGKITIRRNAENR